GQRLFFNQNGQRCSLTGKRKSDFLSESQAAQSGGTSVAAVDREGLNLVLLIQVPLKQKQPMTRSAGMVCLAAGGSGGEVRRKYRKSDVEEAVVGHGKVEGSFTEIDGL